VNRHLPEEKHNAYAPLMVSLESVQGLILLISFLHLDILSIERGKTGRSSPSGSKILTREPLLPVPEGSVGRRFLSYHLWRLQSSVTGDRSTLLLFPLSSSLRQSRRCFCLPLDDARCMQVTWLPHGHVQVACRQGSQPQSSRRGLKAGRHRPRKTCLLTD
jgi:hypothetical protein